MENVSLVNYLLFTLSFTGCLFFLHRAVRPSKAIIIIISAWILLQCGIGIAGFYTETSGTPPRFALLGLPALLFVFIAVFKSPSNTDGGTMLRYLIILQIIRVPVELMLHGLAYDGVIPRSMTFEGFNFDIFSGLSAPLIWILAKRKRLPTWIFISWNLLCLALLINIVAIAILSAPFTFQQLAFHQPNIAILYFPFLLLPAVIVPVVLFSHLMMLKLAFRGLVRKTISIKKESALLTGANA